MYLRGFFNLLGIKSIHRIQGISINNKIKQSWHYNTIKNSHHVNIIASSTHNDKPYSIKIKTPLNYTVCE